MHPIKNVIRRLAWGLAAFGVGVGGAASAQQPGDVIPAPAPRVADVRPPKLDRTGAIIVPVQGTIRLQMKTKARLREVFNERETVLTIREDATSPSTLILSGRAIGLTRISLTDVNGVTETYEVLVQNDVELLRKLIQQAVPTANVQVLPGGTPDSLILSGHVANAGDVDTVVRVASSAVGGGTATGNIVNALTVGGVSQVQLDCVVASVNRTEARRRGFSFGISDGSGRFYSVLGTSGFQDIVSSLIGSTPLVQPGGDANLGANFTLGRTSIQTFLQALRTEGITRILAEPKVVAHSGRVARFLAGGRQAVPSATGGFGGGAPGITFEDVGTELNFLPIVYGNGKIFLEVEPRIRQVSDAFGAAGPFGRAPGFLEQTVRTAVLLESGQTLALGGLIQSNTQNQNAKVPFLGDLPFLGTLFSSTAADENEQELIILVTPHLVDPLDCAQLPKRLPGRESRMPSDYEFYLENLIEAPRGPRTVFENRRYKAAWKNDPSAAYYPCAGGNCGTAAAPGAPGAPCGPNGCAPATLAPAIEYQAGPVTQPAYSPAFGPVEGTPTAAPTSLPPVSAVPGGPQR